MPASPAFFVKMNKFILGIKVGMSQIFKEDGTVVPVTLVQIKPNTVVQIKTTEKDGYQSVQLGIGTKKKLTKPQKGHMKNLGNFAVLKEFKTTAAMPAGRQEYKQGDILEASVFAEGEKVKVTGTTKGKGFQGVVKRHGFRGMPASHGHHSVMRHGGSIGQRFPQHTLPGMRMPGRMGDNRLTVRGLTVVKVDAEKGIIAIKGAVPGNNGSIVQIMTQ